MPNKNTLDASWNYVKLGELVDNPKQDLVDGPFGSNLKAHEYIESGVPVLKIQNIKARKFIDKNICYISEEKAKSLKRHSFLAGDLIITKLGEPLGLCCKVPVKYSSGIIVADLIRLRPNKRKVSDTFLEYVINSEVVQQQFKRITKGTTRARVNLTIVRDIEIPLPPLSSQQKIVSKIEELFSELDKGKQQLEMVKQQLKIYRQAVLKWAFEGRFTNKEIKEGKLPEGWKLLKLREVCNKIQDGSHFSPQTQYIDPDVNRYKYITAKNIRNNYMDLPNVKYVDQEFHDSIFNRCNPEFGDVLLTKDGVNTGEVTLNTLKEEFSLLSSVCIFKTNVQFLKSDFLKYFIQSPYGTKIIEGSMTGTAIKRIILRKIKDAEIFIPSLIEQGIIVQEIESRLSVCDKIEEIIETGLKQTESLRQSILKQAFEGKLVNTNL
jgi:type I restriction enzyme, S subunit